MLPPAVVSDHLDGLGGSRKEVVDALNALEEARSKAGLPRK